MTTNFVNVNGDQSVQTAVDLLNSGSLNFNVVADDGRSEVAIRRVEVFNDPTAGGFGYTFDGLAHLKPGIFRLREQNPSNGEGKVAVNQANVAAFGGEVVATIIHETLHLDKEINTVPVR